MARELDMSLDKYVEAILAAKARGLPVKLGLEVDFEPGTEQKVMDLIAPYPWDYLVGSVHWIGAWWFLRPSGPAEYERRGVRRAFEEYFELATALARDRHGRQPRPRRRDQGRRPRSGRQPALPVGAGSSRRRRRSGMAVEISSQGLLRPIREIYPAPAFLDLFHAAGVPITLGPGRPHARRVGLRLPRRSSPRPAAPATPTTCASTPAAACLRLCRLRRWWFSRGRRSWRRQSRCRKRRRASTTRERNRHEPCDRRRRAQRRRASGLPRWASNGQVDRTETVAARLVHRLEPERIGHVVRIDQVLVRAVRPRHVAEHGLPERHDGLDVRRPGMISRFWIFDGSAAQPDAPRNRRDLLGRRRDLPCVTTVDRRSLLTTVDCVLDGHRPVAA